DVRRRTVFVDPLKQERCTDGELSARITTKPGLLVKSGPHYSAASLLAAVDVQLHRFDNCVVLRSVCADQHACRLAAHPGMVNGQTRKKPATAVHHLGIRPSFRCTIADRATHS